MLYWQTFSTEQNDFNSKCSFTLVEKVESNGWNLKQKTKQQQQQQQQK